MRDGEEQLKNVMTGILSMVEDNNALSATELLKLDNVKKALKSAVDGDIEDFYFSVIYPMEGALDGVVQQVSGNNMVQFLLIHGQFVERQFENIIKKYEGFSCCADKSRTIMNKLFLALLNDEEISFNYDSEYTYHLPKTVFKNHDDIIMFFNGVYALYWGKYEKYIKALNHIIPQEDKS